MNTNDVFSEFDKESGNVLKNLSPFDPSDKGLTEIIERFEGIKTLDEFEIFLKRCVASHDAYVLIRALALSVIYKHAWYQQVDCSSIYEFCEKQPKGSVFQLSKSVVNSDIKTGQVLIVINNNFINDTVNQYLEEYGQKEGKGSKNRNGFKIADFVGHKEKFSGLYKLVTKKPDDPIDWNKFFSSTVDDYKKYVNEYLGSFSKPDSNGYSKEYSLIDSELTDLSPPPYGLEGEPFKPELPKIEISHLPSGVIRDKEMTNLFSLPDKVKNRATIKRYLAKSLEKSDILTRI
jgi:hypothetical protein